jgi:UDPglucose 6-dehydrogenase
MTEAAKLLEGVAFHPNPYEAAQAAHALVIVTEWDSFRALDFPRLKGLMADAVVVDLRNVYRPAEVIHHGFRYECVGRSTAPGHP